MGVAGGTAEKKVAFVKCKGTCDKTKVQYNYYGVDDCKKVSVVPGAGEKACTYGCMGYGSCVKACAFDAIHVVDGTTFEMYRTNMQSMIVDMVTEADMVLFNRCTQDMPLSGWKRSIRAVNRMCEIVFEDAMGEELEVEDILPYSLDQESITLEDDDYGIWYIDIQDHPERYTGKTITFKAQAMTSSKLPKGTFIPGRNAMTCCVDDIRFFGFLCKYDRARSLRKGEWVTVTAEIRWEEAAVYEGEGVVLYAKTVEKADAPKDSLVYFR